MQDYSIYLEPILFFGLLGLLFLKIAKSHGFFHLPHRDEKSNPVRFSTVLLAFAIYLGITLIIAPSLIRSTPLFYNKSPPLSLYGWIQVGSLGMVFLLFYLFCRAQNRVLFSKIWKDRSVPHPKSIVVDILMGILTWVISFPIVIAIGQIADMIIYFFLGLENYEQVAVRYLKTTLDSPPLLAVALFTILIAAPVIEEFLFRGCLQNFFKRSMSPQKSIVLSSLCFSLFHYASTQGIGNISLIVSLFSFALFLGYIYERQASLFASVGLHITFNAVSTFRILFFPE